VAKKENEKQSQIYQNIIYRISVLYFGSERLIWVIYNLKSDGGASNPFPASPYLTEPAKNAQCTVKKNIIPVHKNFLCIYKGASRGKKVDTKNENFYIFLKYFLFFAIFHVFFNKIHQ
jgi:hypothetical protein